MPAHAHGADGEDEIRNVNQPRHPAHTSRRKRYRPNKKCNSDPVWKNPSPEETTGEHGKSGGKRRTEQVRHQQHVIEDLGNEVRVGFDLSIYEREHELENHDVRDSDQARTRQMSRVLTDSGFQCDQALRANRDWP